MTKDDLIRVRICDPDHPHYPESGVLTGTIIMVLGTAMAEMKIVGCKHGTSGCFVAKGQVTRERREA